MTKATKTHRAGFGPHCRLHYSGHRRSTEGTLFPVYNAQWKNTHALNRDGTLREFATPDGARAWLAAADVTNGATARPL